MTQPTETPTEIAERRRFRKKPVVIEAIQWTGENADEIQKFLMLTEHAAAGWVKGRYVEIGTLEGLMVASPNDWIIKGIQDEFYPCKPDIFTTTYEPATESKKKSNEAQQLSDTTKEKPACSMGEAMETAQEIAERLLPCATDIDNAACYDDKHGSWCPAYYRPAIAAALRAKDDALNDLIEREAACCPEDMPFDEYIKSLENQVVAQEQRIAQLEAKLAGLTVQHAELVDMTAEVIVERDEYRKALTNAQKNLAVAKKIIADWQRISDVKS